jgi:hypothetical protein
MERVVVNDPNNVQIIVGGVPVEGFGTGDFLTIAQAEDTFTDTTGADGETIRSKSNPSPMVTITIVLMEGSLGNTFLSGLHEVDRQTPNGAGVVPFLYKDGSGTSIFASEKCWISKPPDMVKGKEGKERSWTLRAKTSVRLDGSM